MSHVILPAFGWNQSINFCVESIRRYSPDTIIHVLGDEVTRRHYPDAIPIEKYCDWANMFGKVFTHFSVNASDFELVCFQRWFVIYEYITRNSITPIWSFDWDTLIFTDLEKESPSVSMTSPLHNFYCRNHEWMKTWLEMVYEAFERRSSLFERWTRNYLSGSWDSVSDMSIALETTSALNELHEVKCTGFWDHNFVTSAQGFDLNISTTARTLNRKKIEWREGFPFAFHNLGLWIPMKSFHCWGSSRENMGTYLDSGEASIEKSLLEFPNSFVLDLSGG